MRHMYMVQLRYITSTMWPYMLKACTYRSACPTGWRRTRRIPAVKGGRQLGPGLMPPMLQTGELWAKAGMGEFSVEKLKKMGKGVDLNADRSL